MATLKAVIRRRDKETQFFDVYIRVIHNSKVGYIKTGKKVSAKDLTANDEITDPFVMKYCASKLIEYTKALNNINVSRMTVQEIIEYIKNGDSDICFSDYAKNVHIAKLINNNQDRNAKNYILAVRHLEHFMGTDKIMFSHLTSVAINHWIQTLGSTHRAKELYPVCIRQIFRAAVTEYNDYENEIIRIKSNPWMRVKIPLADKAEKLAITPEECRLFFSHPIPESRMNCPLAELGRDVAMMILCLAGINTVDIYNLKKKNYTNGIIRYQRAKTKKSRADGAYMEMRVPPIIQPLIEKYMSEEKDEFLFMFHRRMTTSDSFNANVNIGIRQICASMGIEKEKRYSGYTFRHTWGTVAQNDVGASISDVAFAMNHSAGFNITRGYIKIDYTPAWELNEKVVDFIFFSGKTSSKERQKEETEHFKLSVKHMVNAVAYYNGKKEVELNDIGFRNVDEVISKLVQKLRENIPERSMVMFKITNMDKDQTVVYQRQKGKGF